MYIVKTYGVDTEYEAVESFLKWQNINFDSKNTAEVLGITKGHPAVLLFENDLLKARGFFEIVKYFEQQGFILC